MNTTIMAKFGRKGDAIEALNEVERDCHPIQIKLINRDDFKSFMVDQRREKKKHQLLIYSSVGILAGMALGLLMDFFLTESIPFKYYIEEHLAIFLTLGMVGGLLIANALYFISKEDAVTLSKHDMDNSKFLALVQVPQEEDSKVQSILKRFKALNVLHA